MSCGTWRRARDDAVTPIVGGILMMALMMTLVPGALMLKQAMSDEMAAQREAAERAAFCARHPDSKVMDCRKTGPMPGYVCEQAGPDVFVCVPEEVDAATLPSLIEMPPGLAAPDRPEPAPPTPSQAF